jgi:hypothetical protein
MTAYEVITATPTRWLQGRQIATINRAALVGGLLRDWCEGVLNDQRLFGEVGPGEQDYQGLAEQLRTDALAMGRGW